MLNHIRYREIEANLASCYGGPELETKVYRGTRREWHVPFHPSSNEFRCECKRIESVDLPCLAVLVFLDVEDFT